MNPGTLHLPLQNNFLFSTTKFSHYNFKITVDAMEHAKKPPILVLQQALRSNPRGKFVEGVEVYPHKRLQPAPSVRSDDPRERTRLESGIKRLGSIPGPTVKHVDVVIVLELGYDAISSCTRWTRSNVHELDTGEKRGRVCSRVGRHPRCTRATHACYLCYSPTGDVYPRLFHASFLNG